MGAELPSRPDAARFRPMSLDALNFLLADVRGALGPFLNVFLVTPDIAKKDLICQFHKLWGEILWGEIANRDLGRRPRHLAGY
jgi:hypothetical protein